MSELAKWLLGLIKDLFKAVWDFITDLMIALADLILTALLGLLSALPLPDFLKPGSLAALFTAIPGEVWYFAGKFRLGECMAMFGAAVAFRLARKALTLFQW